MQVGPSQQPFRVFVAYHLRIQLKVWDLPELQEIYFIFTIVVKVGFQQREYLLDHIQHQVVWVGIYVHHPFLVVLRIQIFRVVEEQV